MEIKNEKKPVSRKKFLFWTVTAVSVFTAAKHFFSHHSKSNATTIKMLTQDGKLVEVEASKLSSRRKKIKDAEIHTWVQRKSTL